MTPESYSLQIALTAVALLLAALGAVLLYNGAREDSPAPPLDLTDARVALGDEEFRQLHAFITNDLLDPQTRPENPRKHIPARLPGERPVHVFQP